MANKFFIEGWKVFRLRVSYRGQIESRLLKPYDGQTVYIIPVEDDSNDSY